MPDVIVREVAGVTVVVDGLALVAESQGLAKQSELKAQAWAEGTLPGGSGTKSAKEFAEEAATSAGDAAAAAALQPAPATIIGTRALVEADSYQLNMLAIPAPGPGSAATLVVPSHSVSASPAGRRFRFLKKAGTAIRFVPDATGAAVIVGNDLGLATNNRACELVNEAPDQWYLYGQTEAAPAPLTNPGTHEYWVDWSDFDSMRREHTGASATTRVTAVGQPIGSILNKGTLGGWFVCPDSARRYTLELIDGAYACRRASATSFWKHNVSGLRLDQLDLFVGCKIMTQEASKGIISFQSATNSGVNRNDGGYFAMGDPLHSASLRLGSPAAIPGVTGFLGKYSKVFRLQKAGNSGPARLWVDNSYDPVDEVNTVTSLSTMARAMALGAMQGNNAEGFTDFGDVAFFCIVGGGAILTAPQAAQAQAFVESRTYGVNPTYPAITTLAQLEASRAARITEVFGGGGLPTSTLGTISTDTTPPVTGLTNLASSEKMTVPGYAAVPRIYTPNSARTDRIVISWEGHSAAFGSNGIKTNVIQKCLTANVPVCCLVLPGGSNDYTSGNPTQHVSLVTSYAQWFGPAVIAINTMLNRYPGAKVIMTGISGGGWSSLMCAALDKRIATSLQVVGWSPEHIHLARDAEQELLQVGCGYMELALLAAGDGRRCLPRWHNLDTVGFGRTIYDSRPDVLPTLKTMATTLGGTLLENWENVAPHAYSTADGNALAAEFA